MTDAPLLRTPLYALHAELGARFTSFAGYEMPVQYADGVLKEHVRTRAAAGLFDVSHMGQIRLWPISGVVDDAARALEALTPTDVVGLAEGRQRYGLFTNAEGGVLDDLMIARRADHLFLVVNAACKAADLALLNAGLGAACRVEMLDDRALLALQGPGAEAAVAALAPEAAEMRFMDVRALTLAGAAAVVSRSGYTGEDGFEISVPAADAEGLARALLETGDVAPIGLGARDSLRLEAGLCLYGADMDAATTPSEAALDWAIQKTRRRGGARAGGFPGAERILAEIEDGASRRRVGLLAEGRAPVRGGAALFADAEGGEPIGAVTSGGFGPSVERPVAMGYVPKDRADIGTRLFAEVRGKRLPLAVAPTPFVTQRYKRP